MPHSKETAVEISVVIPCYGSASILPELIDRLTKELESRKVGYEIILVNDCSSDNLAEVAPNLVQTRPALRYIELMYNIGQHRALMCGLARAKGRFVVTMDDDLQHPPEEIHKLIDRLANDPGLDAVFGSYDIKRHSFIRNVGSQFIRFINKIIFRKPPGLEMSAFRCLRRELVDALVLNRTHYPVIGPLLLKNTRRIVNVKVRHESRSCGSSTYNAVRLLRTLLDNILNFSSLPLQIISMIGVGVAVLSFLLNLGFVIEYIVKGSSVPGWTSLFLAMNFYAGLVLLAIGVIGEYLIRILGESKDEPLYIVRREMSGKGS
jgi:polyisoprenyl-phosphate glycosyltransferase